MFLTIFTIVHVLLSLLGIAAGFVVFFGYSAGKRLNGWTAFFLATTLLTSITGFGFPFEKVLPAHILGVLSLIVLAAAIYAWYGRQLIGRWRTIYLANAAVAQYFNVFVLVVQAFLKVPALKSLAPTQTELPFVVAQLLAIVGMTALGVLSLEAVSRDARSGGVGVVALTSTDPTPPGDQPSFAIGCGGFLGFVVYLLACFATLAGVPRRSENIREVVDLPWTVFALLPTILAFTLLLGASFCLPNRRARGYFIVAFSAVIGVCTYLAIDLLRRDYIGKL